MESSTKEFRDVCNTLRSDVLTILKWTKSQSDDQPETPPLTQAERRSAIRAIFAFVEATCYFLRAMLLDNSAIEKLPLPERLALAEEQVSLSPAGIVQTTRLRVGAMPLVRMTFKALADTLPKGSVPQCAGRNFEALSDSVAVRDRLMHPKASSHLEVTDAEFEKALLGYRWMNDSLQITLEVYVEFLQVELDRLKAEVAFEESRLILPGLGIVGSARAPSIPDEKKPSD